MTDRGKPKHRNNIYGDIEPPGDNHYPAIPAATVVLLRDGTSSVETLLLHRTSKVHFADMWVFPGGRIDEADYSAEGDLHVAARRAAARETLEETGVHVSPHDFVCFAHWTPPPTTPRRYATWFFATALDDNQAVTVDGDEIQNHQWVSPEEMLAQQANGRVDLAPPTWVTLYQLSLYKPVSALLEQLAANPQRTYQTRLAKRNDGVRVAMWAGDAGYETSDPDADGERHRLVLADGGFVFENTVENY